MVVPADQLDAEIEKILKAAKAKADNELQDILKDVAKTAADVVKKNAPVGHNESRRGKYKNSLSYKKKGSGYVVYSKDQYQLTHLLEFGHAIAGGTGTTTAFPHFSIALDHALKRTEEELKKIKL